MTPNTDTTDGLACNIPAAHAMGQNDIGEQKIDVWILFEAHHGGVPISGLDGVVPEVGQ